MARKTKKRKDDEAAEELARSEERVAELEVRCAELEAQALRAQADYKNLRRRSLTDVEGETKRQMQPLLEELLLTLDFLDMALKSPATNDETKNLVLGIQMTRTKFVQALESVQVQEVDTSGTFDPALHDASATREEEGAEPGAILEVQRKGYSWQGTVLRPAQVVVAPLAEEPAEASDAPETDEDDAGEASATDAQETEGPGDTE